VCLVPVRWDTAFSLDETLRRWRGRGYVQDLRDKSFGYAVWIPGLVVGSVWASAAYAKLKLSGPSWVLGGAVKYHWIIDAQNAPVNWAEWIAVHHWAAVLMSFAGVLFESVFVLSVLAKPGLWRALLASTGFRPDTRLLSVSRRAMVALDPGVSQLRDSMGLALHVRRVSAGGENVPLRFNVSREPAGRTFAAWIGLVQSHTLRGRSGPVAVRRRAVPAKGLAAVVAARALQPIHWLFIFAVCLHAAFELPGGYGRFTAYSDTYQSTEEFDRMNPLKRVYRVWVRYGSADAVEVRNELVMDAVLRLTRNEPLPPHYSEQFRSNDALNRLFGAGPRHLTLTSERRSFNWEEGRFNPYEPAMVVGTLELDSMALTASGLVHRQLDRDAKTGTIP
jgi:hypothetical protein